MKKKTTKVQPKTKDFIKGTSDKLIKNYKLDGVIVIAAKGDEIKIDIDIPARLAPRVLKSLEKTSETILQFYTKK